MLHAIFFITMYPCLFLLYYVQKNEGIYKHHHLFGISVSSEWLTEEERNTFCTSFQRKMKRSFLILALFPLVTLLIPYFSIYITLWIAWLLVVIVSFTLPFAQGYHSLLALKQERLPDTANQSISYTELKNVGVIRVIQKTDFWLPNLISLGLALFSLFFLHKERYEMYNVLIVLFALCTPLFYGCAQFMDRMKTTVISTNSDININYTRANKQLWKQFWNFCSWLNTIYTLLLFMATALSNFTDAFLVSFILWGSILYGILSIVLCLRLLQKKQLLDAQYLDKMDIPADENEKSWIGGILYYNPKDTHVMVSKKYGMGTTVNLATSAGKGSMLFTILTLLSLPILCIWMMLEEFTPISLSLENQELVATQWKRDYQIPASSIQNVTLVKEVPKSTKINGTGMDSLKKGTYRNRADGKVQFFLNPQNEVFLRFTSGDTIYYMSGFDDEETLSIYDLLQ